MALKEDECSLCKFDPRGNEPGDFDEEKIQRMSLGKKL